MTINIYHAIEQEYVVWLEPTLLHFHPGDTVEVKALWGHGMKKEAVDNIDDWQSYVTEPTGEIKKAEIVEGESHPVVRFKAGESGLYHLHVENNAGEMDGVYCRQWARLPVPVGHHVHGKGVAVKEGLEIVPNEYRQYGVGDTIYFKVFLNGKPLPDVDVKACYHLYEGDGYPYNGSTDKDGEFNFIFEEKGHWMFMVKYQGEEVLYTCTYVIPGVR